MKKKLISMMLVTALTVSTLAGCGGNEAADSGSEQDSAVSETPEENDAAEEVPEDAAEQTETSDAGAKDRKPAIWEIMFFRNWKMRRSHILIFPLREKNCMNRR